MVNALALLVLLLAVPARAQTTHTLADCELATFEAQVTAATAGDTIQFPAGSCTWASATTVTKKLNIVGAGTGQTVITLTASGNYAISLGTTNSSWSHTTLTSTVLSDQFLLISGSDGTGRIHHNEFISDDFRRCVFATGGSGGAHPVYLIDNNTFTNCRVSVVGDTGNGDKEWEAARPFGVFEHVVYVEDNTWTFAVHGNVIEVDYGGMAVFRFNTVNWNSGASGVAVETHGTGASTDRGGRWLEVYGNTFQGNNADPRAIWLRGGSGIIFSNTANATYDTRYIDFDISTDRQGGVGMPDGTKAQDGNYFTSGTSYPGAGWPALENVGFGTFAGAFDGTNFPGMAKAPIPIFLNRKSNGSQAPITLVNSSGQWIADCHEYQNEVALASFDGTCGTTVGTKAEMDAETTCTATSAASSGVNGTSSVFFWVTDEGEWNSESAGNDGRLYRCNPTNTWELFYTPLAYPHELQSAGGAGAGGASTGAGSRLRLRIRG